ncbi:MAG: hypothetical protein LiPW39_610 [Parcubacteria group bacterium LiPW_39]|nr:MAG: hypothetical protein LiPW39_610 [Parcubacteria group bacterium LiPW_39]
MENLNLENQKIEAGVPAKKKWVIFFVSLLALVLFFAAGLFYIWFQIYWPPNKNGSEQIFEAEKGKRVAEIAAKLQAQNLIRSAFWFKVYVGYKKQSSALQAGKYSLSPALSIPEIAAIMTGGRVIFDEIQITFPEGFTFKQVKARLLEQGLAAAEFLDGEKIADYQVQYKFLSEAPAGVNLEGFLFPDTYRFKRDIKKEEIAKKFLDNFDRKLAPALREAISRQGKTIYEIVNLAALVQQEAVSEEEMPLIAGVFVNRLRLGMALQSDASVNYVTGKKERQPTWDDTKVASPYNTYLHTGLPPTPICNPGIEAIKAAVYPQASDYLYFLHPFNSSAIYSKTMEEHNKNKEKYLR